NTVNKTLTRFVLVGRFSGVWTADMVRGFGFGAAMGGGLGAKMTRVASASTRGFVLRVVGLFFLAVWVVLGGFWLNV
ncbi:enterobactin transporter EntS, partial [Enterobacter hormaechei]